MKTKNAPSYQDMEALEECYNKCRFMLNDKRLGVKKNIFDLNKSDKFFYQHFYGTQDEFIQMLKKDLQKVIKSLHFKHMDNELK